MSQKDSRRGATTSPGDLVARPGPGRALWSPGWLGPPLGTPLGLYISPIAETLNIQTIFPEAIPISIAIASKLRGTRSSCPGTLPGRGSAPGFISIDVASFLHDEGVVPLRG